MTEATLWFLSHKMNKIYFKGMSYKWFVPTGITGGVITGFTNSRSFDWWPHGYHSWRIYTPLEEL